MKLRTLLITGLFAVTPAVFAEESNATPAPNTEEVSPELTALQKDVTESEQLLAETQAEIESLKNELINSEKEREQYDNEVKMLTEQLEQVQ